MGQQEKDTVCQKWQTKKVKVHLPGLLWGKHLGSISRTHTHPMLSVAIQLHAAHDFKHVF